MEDQMKLLVNTLNRFYNLRFHEKAHITVYRYYRTEKAFKEFFEQVSSQYEIIPLDNISNYEKLIGHK